MSIKNTAVKNLKEAAEALASSVTGSVRVATKAANSAVKIANKAINTTGQISQKAIQTTGNITTAALNITSKTVNTGTKIAGEGLDAASSVATASGIVIKAVSAEGAKSVESVAKSTSQIVNTTAKTVANTINVTMNASSNIYKTVIGQSALLATGAIKAFTEGPGGALQIMGARQETWRKSKMESITQTQQIKINNSVRKELKDDFINLSTQLSIGIIASVNTYILCLGELRHLIYMEKGIRHIWKSNSGIPKFSLPFKKRTNNANHVEKTVRSIWNEAKRQKEFIEIDLKQLINRYTIELQNELIAANNKTIVFEKIITELSEDVAKMLFSIKSKFSGLQNELKKILSPETKNKMNNTRNLVNAVEKVQSAGRK